MKRMRYLPYPIAIAVSLFLATLAVTGCSDNSDKVPTVSQVESANQAADSQNIPPNLRPLYVDLQTQGERNYVLNAMRLGLAAARQGDNQLAKQVFDEAIKRVESLQAGSSQADNAKSNFTAEDRKWFKGESYERAALYIYRGFLYLADSDYGNAAACAKRAQIQALAEDQQFSGDFYSAEWLLAYASLQSGQPDVAADALRRANAFPSKQGNVLPPHQGDNVLIIAEAGQGPIKYAIGQYHDKLAFEPGGEATAHISVEAGDAPPQITAPAENLYFQATTRGKRKVDYILAGKAHFKEATDLGGDAAIAAGAGVALASRRGVGTLVGLGLIAGGLVSKGVSASTVPRADTRTWNNLPQDLFLYSLHCPSGTTHLQIKALDPAGNNLKQINQDIVLNSQTTALLWVTLP